MSLRLILFLIQMISTFAADNSFSKPGIILSFFAVNIFLWPQRRCFAGRFTTPIRNACFSHEFSDMLTLVASFWIAFKNLQRVAALQIAQKIIPDGVLH